jgi:hypothetical protein
MPANRAVSEFNHYLLNSQPYDILYRHKLLEQLKGQGLAIDNPNVYVGLNSNIFNDVDDYMRMSQIPEYLYQIQQNPFAGYNNIYERDIINVFNDREILNRQARMTSEGVNNIVAAFFIKSVQGKRNNIKPVETVIHDNSSTNNSEQPSKPFMDIQSDLNSITNNQLSSVNDMMKKIIEKEYTK